MDKKTPCAFQAGNLLSVVQAKGALKVVVADNFGSYHAWDAASENLTDVPSLPGVPSGNALMDRVRCNKLNVHNPRRLHQAWKFTVYAEGQPQAVLERVSNKYDLIDLCTVHLILLETRDTHHTHATSPSNTHLAACAGG